MTTTSTADNIQVAGSHYKTANQHWNLLPAIGYGHEYYTGQASKYLIRWHKKNGHVDIAKAEHFVQKLLELAEQSMSNLFLPLGHDWVEPGERAPHHARVKHTADSVRECCQLNECDTETTEAIVTLMTAECIADLRYALHLCERLKKRVVDTKQFVQIETPVTQQFKFLHYTDAERNNVLWQCERCDAKLDLGLNEPPAKAHQCGGSTAQT